MKKLRVYLDTSVVNFLFAEDAPDFQRVTEEFFSRYAERYELFASAVMLLEISRDANLGHRQKLLDVLRTHPISILSDQQHDEIERLARLLLERKVIPAKKYEDALHVSYAIVHEMDILLSWNFKHLANVRRETLITAVAQEQGYRHPLRLLSPLEAEYED
jgi:hypothetical protein